MNLRKILLGAIIVILYIIGRAGIYFFPRMPYFVKKIIILLLW
jgi:hypothetical protein